MRKRELHYLYILIFALVLGILSVYYYRFSRQIEEHSAQQLNMTFELILDDLKKRADELTVRLEQFARNSLAGPIYLTQLIRQEIKQQAYQGTIKEVRRLTPYLSLVVHEIRKLGRELAADSILVYNSEGSLLTVYKKTTLDDVAGVYLPSISKQTFISLEPKESWLLDVQSISALPQQPLPQRISPLYQGEFPETLQVELTRFDGSLGLQVLAPITVQGKLEGLCVCYVAIKQQDVERYSRLSQTSVNIFAGPELSAGTLPEYIHIDEEHLQTLQGFDLQALSTKPEIRNVKVSISDEHYYQGLLSLQSHHVPLGTIAVFLPRYLDRRRQGEFGILIVATILLFGVLYKDIRRAENIEELNRELKARSTELERTNAQLTDEIRERNKMERELHAAKNAAESSNYAKSRFLANMSHELRTPLNAILGYTQILKKSPTLNELQQRGLTTIHQSGEHLLTLITEMLDLAKIEAGHMELQEQPTLSVELFDSLADMIRIRAQQKRLHFNYECDPSLPKSVFVDPKRLREILLNLLGNAVKLTENGSVTFRVTHLAERGHVPESASPTVRQQLTQDEQHVTILFEIEDTGPGIPDKLLQEIFAPFHQLPEHRTLSRGTGLGLTISQKFVEMMGGKIRVRSTVGQGSTFFFVLTLRKAAYAESTAELSRKKIIGYTGIRRQVLVVDDTAENRAVLKDMLGPLGFQIVEAKNGREGVRMAAETSPALVLLDLVMPEMDGFEMARQIRKSPAIQDIPLIAVSANAFDEVRTRCLEAGCNDFITKPLQVKHLLELLERYLQLEWIYESENASNIKENSENGRKLSHTLKLLPDARRLSLLEQVHRGDVKGILKELEQIETLGEQVQPFVAELRRLTKAFQIERMTKSLSLENDDDE